MGAVARRVRDGARADPAAPGLRLHADAAGAAAGGAGRARGEKFDADGRLTDEKTKEVVRALLVALQGWTERLETRSRLTVRPGIDPLIDRNTCGRSLV